MTPAEYDAQSAIDRLRRLENRWSHVGEDFCQRWDLATLLLLDKMWCLSEWDFPPDRWTIKQISQARRGLVPMWDDREKPVYHKNTQGLLRVDQ